MLRRLTIHSLLLLAFLSHGGWAPAFASEWDGRTVLLVVTGPAPEDGAPDPVLTELRRLQDSLPLGPTLMPLVIMRVGEKGTEESYFPRLGFKAEDLPVICVVEWGNPARFGPKKVLAGAIVRKAEPRHAATMVNAFMAASHLEARVPEPPAPEAVRNTTPGKLEIDAVRFEIGGTVLNTAARVRNVDDRRLENITVRFYFRLPEVSDWTLLEEQVIAALPPGQVAARDHLTDTGKLGLLSTTLKAAHCFYKVEVDHLGNTSVREGEYRSPTGPDRS